MIPIYEESADHLQIVEQKSTHIPPHLHQSIEIILVSKGGLVAGTGIDLFDMHKGDLCIIFPNLIHHYQIFSPGENRHITLLASPSYFGSYAELLRTCEPENPVISAEKLHPNITYALDNLLEINRGLVYSSPLDSQKKTHRKSQHLAPNTKSQLSDPNTGSHSFALKTKKNSVMPASAAPSQTSVNTLALNHAFTQIILARCMPLLTLRERADLKDHDIVYQTAVYISAHYKENITLSGMAQALGISHLSLSRVFSGVFHQNFNHYLNDVRLEHAAAMLTDGDESVTEIYLDCGFQSQATFNRVFQARYHMTPRQYRSLKGTAAES